jgi:hypothetical protein
MLQQFLEQKRDIILKNWIDQTFNTYKPEMVRFLRKESNQFANPVGHTIITCLEKLYDSLLKGIGVSEYQELEELIKVRAVQDFSPSNSLSFIFDLKKIVRDELADSEQLENLIRELCIFEEKIDTLLALAFDLYTQTRDKIHEIRLREVKARTQGVFENTRKIKKQ